MAFLLRVTVLAASVLSLPLSVSGGENHGSRTILVLTIPLPQGVSASCEAEASRVADPLAVLLQLPVFSECLRIDNPMPDDSAEGIGPGQAEL